MTIVNYDATENPIIAAFHNCNHFIRGLMGPVGSGKSVACSIEVLRRAVEQLPNADGIRKTRFVCVRNTYRELVDTTMNTFQEWVPEELGRMRKSEHQFDMKFALADDTFVQCEVLFRALDTPKDLRKLLSLEVTGAWFNEAREVLWGVIDLMQTRVGRYPKLKFPDVGPTWNGIWLDTNPPDTDSKMYKIFEEIRPDNYILFRQPGGLTKNAENIQNLIPNYYSRLIDGKSDDWVSVYVHGEYGFVCDGKPVFPEYKDNVHCVHLDYKPVTTSPIYIGIDFGLTPAAVLGQLTTSGKWVIFDELVTEDMGASRFAKELNRKINAKYRDHDYLVYGDPAGDIRSQSDESTVYQVLRKNHIFAVPAPTNDPVVRFEAVRSVLTRMDDDATPGFIITPNCSMLRKSLKGGYSYRRMQIANLERYDDKPDKRSIYSHVNDALQYLLCGAGEGNKAIKSSKAAEKLNYDFFDKVIV